MPFNNYFQYHYPKTKKPKVKKTNKIKLSYSSFIKLLTLGIFVIFIIALIIVSNTSKTNYQVYAVEFNVSDKDLLNVYDEGINYDIDLSNQEESLLISNPGTYNLTGNMTNNIIINAVEDQKLYLNFNNVIINSSDSCLVIQSAKHVYLSFTGNNTFTTTNAAYDSTIYSKCDLSISGEGSLDVTSNLDGIKSLDDLTICNLELTINADKHGINVNDRFDIYNTKVDITSSMDGIHSGSSDDLDNEKTYVTIKESELTINAKGDAVESTGVIGIVSGTIDLTTKLNALNSSASKDGLKSEKCVKIVGGTTTLSTYEHGIKAPLLEIDDGTITIKSTKDAIHVDDSVVISGGTIDITAGDDAIHSDNDLYIKGGTTTVNSCYEGLEGINIYIQGGVTSIKSSDDGVNVSCNPNESMGMGGLGMGGSSSSKPNSGKLDISGGILYVNATGDGLDSNDEIIMTGGLVLVDGPTSSANGALDYDTTCKIIGGTLIACGATGMAQCATSGACGGLYTVSGSANKTFLITDSDGDLVLAYTPSKAYQCIALTSDLLTKNQEYNIYINATVTGDGDFGFITEGTIESTGTLKQTFTATNTYSSSSSGMGGMGGGGMGGGGRR